MSDLKFEIIKEIGQLSESNKGWKKELNIVSWSDNKPKYDIREWAPNHEKMSKGITLSTEELKELKDLLNNMEF